MSQRKLLRKYCVHEGNPLSTAAFKCFALKKDAERHATRLLKRSPQMRVWVSARNVHKRQANFQGVGRERPLHMAEFFIGRAVGEKPGTIYKDDGTGTSKRPTCRVGLGLKTVDGVIPAKQAQEIFLHARSHFLGGEKAGAGATAFTADGVWRDPESGKLFKEPTLVGQVFWAPHPYEPTPAVFRSQMKKLCEDVACRLAQKEVLVRLTDGTHTTITRCSPRGKGRRANDPDLSD